jgi:outer membrane protein assembly factor BamB
MRTLLALALLMLTAAATLGQGDIRIHTNPKMPPKDVLESLSLKKGWHAKLPMDGLRDGFYSLQLIPGPQFTLLLVQTYQGSVIAINADNGDILWQTPVGLPYQLMQPAGYNNIAIFVCRRENLYVLDRDDGKQQLYTVESETNKPVYGLALEAVPSAGLVADDDYVFIPFTDRLVRYFVPNYRTVFKEMARVPEAGAKLKEPPQLVRQWSYNTFGGQILQTPIMQPGFIALVDAQGMIFTVDKEKGETISRFKTEGAIAAPVAYNKANLYIPSQDYMLYGLDAGKNRLEWRFAGQSQILHKPEATDRDVFVTPSKGGMYRVDRKSGDGVWNNKNAYQFLATNERFVYVLDKQGKLLVLDYERGKELARYDMRDWIVPVPNDFTDRIFLASHDGQILCLHHRDLTKPLRIKTFEVEKVIKKPKDGDKEKEKEKDKGDKDDKGDKGDKGQMSWAPAARPALAALTPGRAAWWAARPEPGDERHWFAYWRKGIAG